MDLQNVQSASPEVRGLYDKRQVLQRALEVVQSHELAELWPATPMARNMAKKYLREAVRELDRVILSRVFDE